MSSIPVNNSSFIAKVNLPNGLTTDYGKTITPESVMAEQTKIITKDRRLLDRIYDNIAAQF